MESVMSHLQLHGCHDSVGEVPLSRLHVPTGTPRWWRQPMPSLASWLRSGLVLQSQVCSYSSNKLKWLSVSHLPGLRKRPQVRQQSGSPGALFQPFQQVRKLLHDISLHLKTCLLC